MDHSKQIQMILEKLTSQVNNNNTNIITDQNFNAESDEKRNNKRDTKRSKIKKLTPAQLLVIIGILSGSLGVDSVSLDKDQTVKILLAGSLKRKTALDEMIDELGDMPFEDVFKTMMNRLG